MKISELTSLLARVQSIAGDVEVVLKGAESDAETVITDLGIHLDPSTATPSSSLTISHAAAPAAPVAEPAAPASPVA